MQTKKSVKKISRHLRSLHHHKKTMMSKVTAMADLNKSCDKDREYERNLQNGNGQ
ncbi:hypothetical protein HanIR_Chr14g0672841 [Helianthus annuus]|nr:hypothetical protein HanIR_Chr14g0672841 [Helianthus annuus]